MPEARHRDAWAEEQTAPTRTVFLAEHQSGTVPDNTAQVSGDQTRQARIVGATGGGATTPSNRAEASDEDVLVVVSKLKKYVRDRSGMNTSDGAIAPLSDHLRALCREAIRHAEQEGRKTVMDRDFLPFLNSKR